MNHGMLELDPVLLVPIDDIASWVRDREAALIESEDAMFRAARDRASTDDERRYWEDFLALRAANLKKRPRRP